VTWRAWPGHPSLLGATWDGIGVNYALFSDHASSVELEPTDFDLPSAIDNALTQVRERAGRRGISLGRAIDDRVAMI
jgi:isoamylase